MSPCEHKWEARPEAHSHVMNRYQCRICRAWGWRRWTRKDEPKRLVLGPMTVYMKNGAIVTEPETAWLHAGGIDAISTGVGQAAARTRERAANAMGEHAFDRLIRRGEKL